LQSTSVGKQSEHLHLNGADLQPWHLAVAGGMPL
jgi:hypothetical protein